MIEVLMFIAGSVVGSFLNVCIVRMPYEQSVVKPPSHCPQCKKPVAWHDNIPLISYLILGGKCRHCQTKISFLYFFIELLTAVMFVLFYMYYGLSPLLLPYIFMTSCFIVATMVDFGHRIIPDEISVGGMCFGLLFSLLTPEMHGLVVGLHEHFVLTHLKSLGLSLLGVLIGGGSIYAMGILGDILFKKESMGGGDIKLLAMIGAFMGWEMAILTFFIAPFFGAIFGIIEKFRTKDTTIAYGPFLVLAALICLFRGDEILAWVISGYGLY